jgi:hypothetical protein
MHPDSAVILFRILAVGQCVCAILMQAIGNTLEVYMSLCMAYLNGYLIHWIQNK